MEQQYIVWMDTTAIGTLVHSIEIRNILDSLLYALNTGTDMHSVDPNAGILEILQDFFGSPPDVDGDGRIDILLLDIQDQFAATGSYVAGFFDPNDLYDTAFSNRRDLLYIDLYPTVKYDGQLTIEKAAATIAHEMQHLIHANYEGPEPEYVFINEGLSELAEIVCGFPPRPAVDYFGSPNRALLSWSFDNPLPDYARASLWMHYLFEQIGFSHISDVVQSNETGLADLRKLLVNAGGPDFNTLFHNWQVALHVNARNLNPAFGYAHSKRWNLASHNSVPSIRPPEILEIALPPLSLITIDVPLISDLMVETEHNRGGLQVTSIRMNAEGRALAIEEQELSDQVDCTQQDRHGSFRFLITNPTLQQVEKDSSFTTETVMLYGTRSVQEQTLAYDDGIPDSFHRNASYLQLSGTAQAVASVFAPPGESWLSGISMKILFRSELQGTTLQQSAPRDIDIQIATVQNGYPGTPLTPVITKTFDREFGNLKYQYISLREYYTALQSMPDSFCVVIRNDPGDTNWVAVGMDSTSVSHSLTLSGSPEEPPLWQKMSNTAIGADTMYTLQQFYSCSFLWLPHAR
ncbi:MAG: hypothetical protein K9N46_00040 [Candidatus Marinimicrobia bacterium]|nr:hypothetical protein [Candidatus Neomarinimicrobiota bacterium]MCF7879108.1 hypothetical protein [Candidatus Neomarinimicrobiota bacterium]